MSLTATFDPLLSRVRLAATGLTDAIVDAFGRTVVSGLSSADIGGSYTTSGGSASDYNVSTGLGRITNGSVNVHRFAYLAAQSFNTFDLYCTTASSAVATGASIIPYLLTRWIDANNFYRFEVTFNTTGTVDARIRSVLAGTPTSLGFAANVLSYSAGTLVRCRAQGSGTALKMKIWLAADPEPASWNLEVTDSSINGAGPVGFGSVLNPGNTNTTPETRFDDLLLLNPSTAVFERSKNNVYWTTVRGGAAVTISVTDTADLDDYEFVPSALNYYRVTQGTNVFTTTITPVQSGVWLKSITRPFLNRAVEVIEYTTVTRPARNGVFDVKGRSYPVAVTDVRGSRRWTMTVKCETVVDADALELVFASGDPLFVQTDGANDIPRGYVVVGDVDRSRYGTVSQRRYFDLPVTEVAPPGPEVYGVTSTCATVLAEFSTCADVLAQFATCADLLEYVANPSVVIVP